MQINVEQALGFGTKAHREGKLQDAERFYRFILELDSSHPDANHNLGLLAISANKDAASLPFFKTALKVSPHVEQFWLSYIDALINQHQFESVSEMLEKARNYGISEEKLNAWESQVALVAGQLNPDGACPPHQLLTILLEHYQNERYNEAESAARSLSIKFPSHNFSWKILGAVLKKKGRASDALFAGQKAVEISPDDAEAHFNLGNSFRDLRRLEEAEASARKAIILKPNFAAAHNNLGNILRELGRLDEAEASYIHAISFEPDFAEAHNNLGITLKVLGRLEEAEESCIQAVALRPSWAEAHSNLGKILLKKGQYRKGLNELLVGDGFIAFDLKNGLSIL